ncbi:MAG: hypothetical protein V4533_05755 [Pseudomonadota bacterium]
MAESLEQVFSVLRETILRSASVMDVATDEPGNVVLKACWSEPGKNEPAWFGAVQLKKNYVSYHLMPLYALPALLDSVPVDLQKRMQGKSCFNFKKIELDLFEALERLTATCADIYSKPISATPHS